MVTSDAVCICVDQNILSSDGLLNKSFIQKFLEFVPNCLCFELVNIEDSELENNLLNNFQKRSIF